MNHRSIRFDRFGTPIVLSSKAFFTGNQGTVSFLGFVNKKPVTGIDLSDGTHLILTLDSTLNFVDTLYSNFSALGFFLAKPNDYIQPLFASRAPFKGILKFDSTFNVIDSISFNYNNPVFPNSNQFVFNGLRHFGDYVILHGHTPGYFHLVRYDTLFQYDNWHISIPTTDSCLFSNRYPGNNEHGNAFNYFMDNDSNWVIFSGRSPVKSNELFFKKLSSPIYKYSNSGQLLWSKCIEPNGYPPSPCLSQNPGPYLGTQILTGTARNDSSYIFVAQNTYGKNHQYSDLRVIIMPSDGSFTPSVGQIELHEASTLSLYPNPCHGQFYIDGIQKDDQIMVFDVSGKLVSSYASSNNDAQSFRLPTNTPNGVYQVKVISANGNLIDTKSLVLQNLD